jgi:hypothetical protein
MSGEQARGDLPGEHRHQDRGVPRASEQDQGRSQEDMEGM